MVRHPPLYLGTNPSPEVRKLGKGGDSKGPKIRPSSHSFLKVICNGKITHDFYRSLYLFTHTMHKKHIFN